jgi:metallo-beta-lactamase family protein
MARVRAIDHWPLIHHHGGAEGVTGSCHQVFVEDGPAPRSVLIDCGLFQGRDLCGDAFEQLQVHFDVERIIAVIITHVHLDHVGRLPYLLAAGYRGPIVCTPATARLLPLVIEDVLRVGFTRDAALIERVLVHLCAQVHSLAYRRWRTLIDEPTLGVRLRLEPAGHLLGSAYVKLALTRDRREPTARAECRLVFSGDLGAPHTPLLPPPRSPHRADVLVLESTYGDRLHPDRRQRQSQLADAVERALANRGTVLVPAFSVGRTQELLYELEDIIYSRAGWWRELEVIVDSPLAARFTAVYRSLKSAWNREARNRLRAGRHPLGFEMLYTVGDHDEHLRTVAYLARSGRPAVVIAAGGMATGGRVVDYLKAMLGDVRHQVLFVGYQAEGTPGRCIQQAPAEGGVVVLDGERYPIRAGVETLSGYSAHADQADLVRFVTRMQRWPTQIRLVHGEARARAALRARLEAVYAARGRAVTVVSEHARRGSGCL